MKKGERYKIRSYKPGGVQIFEGDATLTKAIDERVHLWHVAFDCDEPGETYERYVQPEDRINHKEDPK